MTKQEFIILFVKDLAIANYKAYPNPSWYPDPSWLIGTATRLADELLRQGILTR